MSIDVDVSTDGVRAPVSRDAIASAARAALRAEKVSNALVSVTLLGRSAIARMNKKHLAHSGATDVISFGFTRATSNDPVVGDIYLSPEVAAENAKARGVSVREEVLRLVVHGTLHVLGHDHPESEARVDSPMWRRQEAIVRRVIASLKRAPRR